MCFSDISIGYLATPIKIVWDLWGKRGHWKRIETKTTNFVNTDYATLIFDRDTKTIQKRQTSSSTNLVGKIG